MLPVIVCFSSSQQSCTLRFRQVVVYCIIRNTNHAKKHSVMYTQQMYCIAVMETHLLWEMHSKNTLTHRHGASCLLQRTVHQKSRSTCTYTEADMESDGTCEGTSRVQRCKRLLLSIWLATIIEASILKALCRMSRAYVSSI